MAPAAKKKPAAKKAPAKKAARKRAPAKAAPEPTTAVGAAMQGARRRLVEAEAVIDAPTPQGKPRRALLGAAEASADEPINSNAGARSDYFAQVDKEGVDFVSAGCTLVDCALGGGWAEGRIVNIVGDKSAGKTLLAIEACANFHLKYIKNEKLKSKRGKIRYAEAEAAFDQGYAEALGLPPGEVDFGDADKPVTTVEEFYEDVLDVLDRNKGRPILYILDSLDALSDEAEAKRDIDDGTFGATKAKKMGELFRRLVQRVEEQRCLIIIISQLRDKIGVQFGEKQTRSGGRALDFYASQIVWLAEIGKIVKELKFDGSGIGEATKTEFGKKAKSTGVKRIVGVDVRLSVKKNKVGLPFRQCEYPIVFGYGIDDLTANAAWLLDVGRGSRLGEVGMSPAGYKVRISNLRDKGGDAAREVREKLDVIVRQEWSDIEKTFLPKAPKY